VSVHSMLGAVVIGAMALAPNAEAQPDPLSDPVDKVASILRTGKQADSAFVLISQQTMALDAFRFSRQAKIAELRPR